MRVNMNLIIEEVKKILPKNTHEYSDSNIWKVYSHLSGFYQDDYFDLCFRESIAGNQSIEISTDTDNVLKYFKIIKKISPKSRITYYKNISNIVTE